MLFSRFATLASVALTARGFVIPEDIASFELDDAKKGQLQTANNGNKAPVLPEGIELPVMRIPCPGCSFYEGKVRGNDVWTEGVENDLVCNLYRPPFYFANRTVQVLHFAVPESSPQSLSINGGQVYPASVFPAPLYAYQVPASVEMEDFFRATQGGDVSTFHSLRLGYELAMKPDPNNVGDEDRILIHFKALEIRDKFINFPSIELMLHKTPEKLVINSLIYEAHPITGPGIELAKAGDMECATFPMMCKLRNILITKAQYMKSQMNRKGGKGGKGCHGKMRGGHKNMVEGGRPGSPNGHHHAHAHGHHHGHRQHSRFHRFMFHLKRVSLQIAAPILIGISAGMFASMIGMIVGQLIVICWRRFYRGETCAARRHQAEQATVNEKESLMIVVEDHDLPEYSDVVIAEDNKSEAKPEKTDL
jgi:hypothetical protein